MADDITVSSSTGLDGNSYTTAVSNDQLTNEDFLNLMIQELKMQDPTKPMDSQQMLATQMQMSTIETNQQTIAAMQALQTAFAQTTLSNAANIIGKNIEDGNISDNGVNKAYTVRSVESVDGDIQVTAQEILYLEDRVINTSDDSIIDYNVNGEIVDSDGNLTGEKVLLANPGEPSVDENGNLIILNANNEQITDHTYALAGVSSAVYSDELTTIPFSTIEKIF